jgi:hypothetical protein
VFSRRKFGWFIGWASFAFAISACRGAPKEAERIELSVGEYDLVVTAGSKPRLEGSGRLSLRSYTSITQLPHYASIRQRRVDHSYRLYGWTNVDFIKLGAPVGPSETPDSRDPASPGVIVMFPPAGFKELQERNVFSVTRPWDAPIMLIGTLENNEATRGWLDGGGIGLFIQSKKGRCLKGEWSSWGLGIGVNDDGSFTLCPLR